MLRAAIGRSFSRNLSTPPIRQYHLSSSSKCLTLFKPHQRSLVLSPLASATTKFSRKDYKEISNHDGGLDAAIRDTKLAERDGKIRVVDESLHASLDPVKFHSEDYKNLHTPEEQFSYWSREAMSRPWATANRYVEDKFIRQEIRRIKIQKWIRKYITRQIDARAMFGRLPKEGPWRDYALLSRMDKPVGTYLLFLPCAMSIALTDVGFATQAYVMALHLWGAFCMRGAGCIVNDMWDRDIDKMVRRTKGRPLAAGRLTMDQAKKSLLVHLLGAVAVLPLLPYPGISLGLAVASLPLIAMYPLAKRFTNMPQLVLGMTFNWGAIMGYAACTGYIDPIITVPLYLSCILWTLYYDTIYAFQDREDDAMLGVKSMALLMVGPPTKRLMTLQVGERARELERMHRDTIDKMQTISCLSGFLLMMACFSAGNYPLQWFLVATIILRRQSTFAIKWKLEDSRSNWELFAAEVKWGFMLVAILWPLVYLLKWLEDLNREQLKQHSGGTMEFRAQVYHINKADTHVRRTDHFAWQAENRKPAIVDGQPPETPAQQSEKS